MSSIDIDNAIIRMYEDIALTDSLDDATAKILHQWGEGQIRLLANRNESPEAFEEQFSGLRKIMKLVNRFTGGRDDMAGEKRQKYLTVLVDNAREMGYPAPLSAVGTVLEAQANLDDAATVRMLLAMVETGSVQTNPLPDQAVETETEVEASVSDQTAETETETEAKPGGFWNVSGLIAELAEKVSEASEQAEDAPTTEDDESEKPNPPKKPFQPGLRDIPGTDLK